MRTIYLHSPIKPYSPKFVKIYTTQINLHTSDQHYCFRSQQTLPNSPNDHDCPCAFLESHPLLSHPELGSYRIISQNQFNVCSGIKYKSSNFNLIYSSAHLKIYHNPYTIGSNLHIVYSRMNR